MVCGSGAGEIDKLVLLRLLRDWNGGSLRRLAGLKICKYPLFSKGILSPCMYICHLRYRLVVGDHRFVIEYPYILWWNVAVLIPLLHARGIPNKEEKKQDHVAIRLELPAYLLCS
ncbi:hypothetical protein I7I48_03575 [Histoplasma ohiense]|nr:hypothetical protein I7I48_03575 [Histoplasma ohiense (nom. inval.)]